MKYFLINTSDKSCPVTAEWLPVIPEITELKDIWVTTEYYNIISFVVMGM